MHEGRDEGRERGRFERTMAAMDGVLVGGYILELVSCNSLRILVFYERIVALSLFARSFGRLTHSGVFEITRNSKAHKK